MKHKANTKAQTVEQVCHLYESQHATLESCCQAAGISYPTFNLWCKADPELGARFRKAKCRQQADYWEEIIKPQAKTALERLLAGADTVIIKEVEIGGPMGQKRRTITRKSGLPDVAALLFVLKGLYPEMFARRPVQTIEITEGQALRFEEIQPEMGQQNGHRMADKNIPATSSNSGHQPPYKALTWHPSGTRTGTSYHIAKQRNNEQTLHWSMDY